jgi:hypothetical protein
LKQFSQIVVTEDGTEIDESLEPDWNVIVKSDLHPLKPDSSLTDEGIQINESDEQSLNA